MNTPDHGKNKDDRDVLGLIFQPLFTLMLVLSTALLGSACLHRIQQDRLSPVTQPEWSKNKEFAERLRMILDEANAGAQPLEDHEDAR